MIRSFGFAASIALCALGCQGQEPESLHREQASEQRELAREQSAEQRELAQEQATERAAAAEAARADLGDRAEEVRDERRDLNAANQELTEAITLACNGVATPDACPVGNSLLQSTANVDHGLSLTLTSDAGSRAEVQQRIDCYRARVALRGTPTPGACLIDLTDENVTVDVSERDGHVIVALTNASDDWVTRFRNEARQTLASLTQRRANGTARN